ncbi:MAG: serine/threonine protein kinase [Rivularia sp. (in: Bacteria)]|nr:serine/threonine protein kinase [Rivularia sp. MS3]
MTLCINPHCAKPENPDKTIFCLGCGSELLLQGRYKVVKYLGGGGFGKTYEIKERNTTVKVLKILHNNAPKAVELFQREAEVLSQLNYPGIPQVEEDGYFIYHPRNQEALHCLVMEKIEGMDLYEYMRQREYRPIDERMAMQWLEELTVILQQVHNHNFFHRDIKPANIMLRAYGGLALIDFGTARVLTDTYWQAHGRGQVTGIVSAGYTPPEQMNGQAIQQSDFFALGRTFVYLLTAKDPNQFYNPQTDELLWRNTVPNISPQFADFLDWMMQRSPSVRPKNTEEILQRLSQIKPISLLPTVQSQIPDNTNKFTISTAISTAQTTQADTPITPITTINAGFFYQWMLSNIVGISIGLFTRIIFRGVVHSIFDKNDLDYYYPMLAAIITLVPVEVMQWLVLKQRIIFNFWYFIEILLGFLIGLFIGTFTGMLFGLEGASLCAVIGVIGGTSIVKLLTISRQTEKYWGWLILSLIGIFVSVLLSSSAGLIADFLLSKVWNSEIAWIVSFVIGVMTTTILSNLITGIGLLKLFRQRVN